MIKKYISFLFFLSVVQFGFSQYKQLSPVAEVSIITAGPGKVLYEGFGHSTIRIKDKGFDLAYNYGIFDFDAPNFYLNFTKGRLLYKLQSYPFHYFVGSYQRDKRWIKEQILNLNQEEKQQFYEFLENNAKPKNATYLYDPYFNNCATKLREITDLVLKERVAFSDSHITEHKSFRQLMNDEITWNSWGSFGINLALGSKLDATATAKEHMYLPDFVLAGFKNATVNRNGTTEQLVKKEHYIIEFKEIEPEASFFGPFSIFLAILILGISITRKDLKNNSRNRWFDFILFFTTGLIGLLIVLLWFFTDHSTAPNNFNFLWAFAPNLVVAFYIVRQKPKAWVSSYLKVLIGMLFLIPFVWLLKIQQLPLASLPLLILLLVRYLGLLKGLLSSQK